MWFTNIDPFNLWKLLQRQCDQPFVSSKPWPGIITIHQDQCTNESYHAWSFFPVQTNLVSNIVESKSGALDAFGSFS